MIHNLNPQDFLTNHWHKAPCLIKGGLSRPPNFVSAHELAGLSLEDEIESRIIRNDNDTWQILHGPFEESIFESLPESHWTLLVQTLDYWVPEIAQLVKSFGFIPRWRFDDVMVSFATDGGGVGPHFDNYDVFLIQSEGERRWRVGKKNKLGNTRKIIDGLIHLENFDPIIDVIMQPGDILYIPPDTAHWGESIGESIGYSVGYRAPQTKDLLALLAEHMETSASANSLNSFFSDSYRAQSNYDNQLESELFDWAQKEIRKLSENQSLINQLLSKSLSCSKLGTPEPQLDKCQLTDAQITSFRLSPGVACNWYRENDEVIFSIEGESLHFSIHYIECVKQLASGEPLEFKGLKGNHKVVAFYETLSRIVDKGYFLYNQ